MNFLIHANEALMAALNDSWLGALVHKYEWAFGALEITHFIGLCILLGALLVVDLRLIGFLRQMPVRWALKYTPWAIVGFTLNLLSGIAFVASDPYNYLLNPAFWVKMVLVALAGLNVAWFELIERKQILAQAEGQVFHISTRIVAGCSLALWIGVIAAGRLLPQFGAAG